MKRQSSTRQTTVLLIFCAAIFLCSGLLLISNLRDAHQFQREMARISDLSPIAYASEHDDSIPYIPDLHALAAENADLVGWISIPETPVDYPVMHTPEDPFYYLDKGFSKTPNAHGLPFLASDCNPDSYFSQLLVYGHYMKDGSLFGTLENYLDEAYLEDHRQIFFAYPGDNGIVVETYELLAVCKTTVSDDGFAFYDYVRLADKDRFAEFWTAVDACAVYRSETPPQFGLRALTLSTCEYSAPNGRLLVVAQYVNTLELEPQQ